jgi:hypothetical protein
MAAAPEAEVPADPVGDSPGKAAGQGVVTDLRDTCPAVSAARSTRRT